MSNSPKKFSKSSAIKYSILLEKWRRLKAVLPRLINNLFDAVFKNMRLCILKEVMSAVNTDGCLTSYDEDIFEYLKRLIGYYDKTVRFYEQNREGFTSVKITELLDGLCAVLASQINQFKESLTPADDNPIITEKRNILEKEMGAFVKEMNSLKKRLMEENGPHYACRMLSELGGEQPQTSKPLADVIYDEIRNEHIKELYNLYKESVKSCVSRLNDLQSRDVTQFYYELLKEEKENLISIVKIQAAAADGEAKTEDEQELVHGMFSIISEGYQYALKEITEVTDKFKEIERKGLSTGVISEDDFREKIRQEIDFDMESGEFITEYNEFKAFSEKFIGDSIENRLRRPGVNLYKMKKTVTEEELLSKDLNEIFLEIKDYTEKNKEELSASGQKEIIMGILETIEIKADSINAAAKEFSEECCKMFAELEADKRKVAESEKKELMEEIFSNVLTVLLKKKETVQDIDDAISLVPMRQIEKQENQYSEMLNRRIGRFCKEQLLYEISTFEEIINYSVSRLRESDEETVRDYVLMIDEAAEKIEKILKKYNIDRIRPKPHDMFNGKEHEVLIAEKNEDFNKGEIIKLMNSGYKKEGLFIIRANVIAAK